MKDTKATIRYAGDDFFVAVPPSGHALTLDMRGERSSAASPLELLLVALGGCTGADVVSILRKKREHVTEYRVEVRTERALTELHIQVEAESNRAAHIEAALTNAFSMRIPVSSVEIGALPRFEAKAKRWVRYDRMTK